MRRATVLLLCVESVMMVAEISLLLSTSIAMSMHDDTASSKTDSNLETVLDVNSLDGHSEKHNEIMEKQESGLKDQPRHLTEKHSHHMAFTARDELITNLERPGVDPVAASDRRESSSSSSTQTHSLPPKPHRDAVHAAHHAHAARIAAPKYMLDLYHKFSTDKYSHPMANIVRSFTNIYEDSSASRMHVTSDGAAAAAAATAGGGSNSTRMHRMLFNVTSIGREEDIYLAELRLFTLVEADRNLYEGINRRVTVSEFVPTKTPIDGGGGGGSTSIPETEMKLELITSKEIYGRHSGWETITITEAVKRWVRQRTTPRKDTHMLEVSIETVARLREDDSIDSTPAPPIVDINAKPHNENEPLLLVFSNDRRRRGYDSRELNEMIEHEADSVDETQTDDRTTDVEYEYYEEELIEENYYDDDATAADRRKKRAAAGAADSAADGFRRKKRSWASRGKTGRRRVTREARQEDTEEDEEEEDLIPMEDYQLEIAKRLRNSHMNDTMVLGGKDDGSNMKHFRHGSQNGQRSDGRKRIRRSRKVNPKRNICRREPMYVDFEDIYWDKWIIAPKGYQAYECTGKCPFPLDERFTPTKHSVIQTLLHAHYPGKFSPACCVPTKLGPISLLYLDEQDVVTYKFKYDGMVVQECGCR